MLRDDSAIQPGLPGWRDRYYESKFGEEFARDKEKFKTVMVKSYTEGLCWVLAYYYKGCQSWAW
jgi:5'-3' exoribonuclease 2